MTLVKKRTVNYSNNNELSQDTGPSSSSVQESGHPTPKSERAKQMEGLIGKS